MLTGVAETVGGGLEEHRLFKIECAYAIRSRVEMMKIEQWWKRSDR